MIFVKLDDGDIVNINSFDELLGLPKIAKFCKTESFKGLCYNTINQIDYVLFLEYTNPIGFMRLGTFTTTFKKLNIPIRDKT